MQEQRKTAKATTSEMIWRRCVNRSSTERLYRRKSWWKQRSRSSSEPAADRSVTRLKQLAMEGMVDYQPNKGCSVALLSPEDAYEVFF